MTTAKKSKAAKPAKKAKKPSPAKAAEREAMKRLMEIAHPSKKAIAERRKLIKELRGSLAHMKYSVDDFIAEKKKEIELEDR